MQIEEPKLTGAVLDIKDVSKAMLASKAILDQLRWQEETLLKELINIRIELNRRCQDCGEVKLATLGSCVKCSKLEVVG